MWIVTVVEMMSGRICLKWNVIVEERTTGRCVVSANGDVKEEVERTMTV